MNKSVADVQTSIISQSGDIYSKINTMVKAVSDISQDTVLPQYNSFSGTYKDSVKKYDNIRNIVVLVIFILPVTSLLFMSAVNSLSRKVNELSPTEPLEKQ